jgi:hypothetical protein
MITLFAATSVQESRWIAGWARMSLEALMNLDERVAYSPQIR